MSQHEEIIRRPAPIKTPRRIGLPSTDGSKIDGWRVVRMEIPASGGACTTSTVHGYANRSEIDCRAKAGELNGKVKLGAGAPLVSYLAMKN